VQLADELRESVKAGKARSMTDRMVELLKRGLEAEGQAMSA
jgi:hypothetical protein